MSPDEIRRSWDDDDTPRSVFPEPLAERLTRENKELRAENERLRGEVAHWEHHAWEAGEGFKRAIESERRAWVGRRAAEARLDALVADLRGLADEWNRLMGWPRNVGAPALAFVLDKHAGAPHD